MAIPLKEQHVFLGIASVIYLSVAFVYLFKHIKKVKIIKKEYLQFWSINWKVGKWLLGSNFLFHISSNIYPWLLLYLTTKDNIAIFGVLMSIASLMNPLLTALSSYLLPIFVKMNHNYTRINAHVIRLVILFGFMALLLIIVGAFFGQHIINLLFGEKYQGLGILVVYPFIVQAINIIFQPFKIALNAIKRTDINFWILIPRSIISITFGYFLIRAYGLQGVFYTMLLENTCYQILNLIMFRGVIKKSPR